MTGRLTKRFGSSAGTVGFCALAMMSVAVPEPAFASDWGCQVVLCLATPAPGSPTTYPACVKPITDLWEHLSLGGAFPTCTGVGVKTRKVKNGYALSVTRPDGITSRYALDTRYQTVTPQ